LLSGNTRAASFHDFIVSDRFWLRFSPRPFRSDCSSPLCQVGSMTC